MVGCFSPVHVSCLEARGHGPLVKLGQRTRAASGDILQQKPAFYVRLHCDFVSCVPTLSSLRLLSRACAILCPVYRFYPAYCQHFCRRFLCHDGRSSLKRRPFLGHVYSGLGSAQDPMLGWLCTQDSIVCSPKMGCCEMRPHCSPLLHEAWRLAAFICFFFNWNVLPDISFSVLCWPCCVDAVPRCQRGFEGGILCRLLTLGPRARSAASASVFTSPDQNAPLFACACGTFPVSSLFAVPS